MHPTGPQPPACLVRSTQCFGTMIVISYCFSSPLSFDGLEILVSKNDEILQLQHNSPQQPRSNQRSVCHFISSVALISSEQFILPRLAANCFEVVHVKRMLRH